MSDALERRWTKVDNEYVTKATDVPFGKGAIALSIAEYNGVPTILIEALKKNGEMFETPDEDNIDRNKLPVLLTFHSKEGMQALYKALQAIESVLQGGDMYEDR